MNQRLTQLAMAVTTSLVLITAPAYAATTIAGTALGNNGCAVAQAEVKLRIEWDGSVSSKPAGNLNQQTSTGPRGGFSFSVNEERLDPDNVTLVSLSATSQGFSTAPAAIAPENFKINGSNAVKLRFPRLPGINDPNTGQPTTTGNCAAAPTTAGGAGGAAGAAGRPAANTSPSRGGKTIEQITPPSEVTTLADRLKGDQPIAKVWRTMLNITNGVAILVFLIMGFATIFSVQVDTYGVKKALPNVIIALILANFSLFITRMVVDIANIGIVAIINNFEGGSVGLINQLLGTFIHGGRDTLGRLIEDFSTNQGGGVYESAIKKVVFVSAIYTAGGYLVLGAVLLAALAIIVPSVFILILAVLFYVRTYVILALAAVSPLAFIAFALPAGQVLFRQWWTQLARWAFMGPIAFFMIWLGITFTKAFGDQFEFGIYLVALTMLYLAISLPFKMGGVITGNLGKYLGKPLRQAGGFGARWYGRTSDVLSGQLSSKLGGRRITPMGLYKGWGANADRYYQRHLADTSGRGEDIREAVTSGAMAFMPWRFGERGAGAKRAFDIMFRGAGVHQQMALAKQISEGANRAAALPEHLVAEGLQDALNRNDPAKAADYLVAKAMQKQDIQADLYDLASRGMAGRPEVSAAMAKAQQTSIENGRPVINPADQDPGYNALERTKKALGNKSPAEQKGIAALWARAVKSDPGNPSHELMAQVIRDVFAPVAITDEVAQALGKFEAVGEVKEIQVDPTAMREAEEFIGQHLSQADFGARFRTGFGLQSGQALNPKSLAALTALQNYQSDNKAKSILADFNSQLESLKNASDINAVARHVSFGSFNTATPASAGVMRAGELLINNSAIGAHFKTNLQTVKNQAVAEIRKVNAVIAREVETQNIDHTVHFNLQAKLNKLAIDPAAKQRASEQLRNLWAHSELERNSLLAKERFSPADKKTKGWLFGRKGQS